MMSFWKGQAALKCRNGIVLYWKGAEMQAVNLKHQLKVL